VNVGVVVDVVDCVVNFFSNKAIFSLKWSWC
jgi:hypothetical protein